MKIPIHT